MTHVLLVVHATSIIISSHELAIDLTVGRRLLVLISTIWAQRTKWTLTRALIGGAQPMEGWWAPVAQPHKRR